jgi:hypothetical protein
VVPDDHRLADDLDRYWDATLRGEAPARPGGIDDIVDAVIARLKEPAITPHLAEAEQRGRQRVVESTMVASATAVRGQAVHPPMTAPDNRGGMSRPNVARVPRTVLILAATILLALGVALAIDILRDRDTDRAGVPAIPAPATPSPAASPTALFEVTLPAEIVPHTTERITGLSYDKYSAGTTSVWQPYCCDGPIVQYQLTGSIQVTGTAEFQIVRADGTIDQIPANTEATVNTGDTLVTLNQTGITTVNRGTVDAEILNWLLLDSPGDRFGGRTGQDGLVGGTHVNVGDFQGNLVDLPGAVTVSLQKLEVEPNEVVHPPPGGVQLALTLDIFYEFVPTVGTDSSFTAHNMNGHPTTPVYVVTLRPADSSGPPGSGTPAQ